MTVSVKNKLDLAITVAVGSSIQIALFVLPVRISFRLNLDLGTYGFGIYSF